MNPPLRFSSSPRSQHIALLLAGFFGSSGLHRFYTGHLAIGFLQLGLSVLSLVLVTLGILQRSHMIVKISAVVLWLPPLWAFVELIWIALGRFQDQQGRELIQPPRMWGRIAVGLAFGLLFVVLSFAPWLGKFSDLARLFSDGGSFMSPLFLGGIVGLLFLGFVLPMVWDKENVPSDADRFWLGLPVLLSFVLVLSLGFSGTFFGLLEARLALPSASMDQFHALGAQYFCIALIASYSATYLTAWLCLAGAILAALACLRSKAATSAPEASVSSAPLLLVFAGAFAVFFFGLTATLFFVGEFAKALDSASADTKARLLLSYASSAATAWNAALFGGLAVGLFGLLALFLTQRLRGLFPLLRSPLGLGAGLLLLFFFLGVAALFHQSGTYLDFVSRPRTALQKSLERPSFHLPSHPKEAQKLPAEHFLLLDQKGQIFFNGEAKTSSDFEAILGELQQNQKARQQPRLGWLVDKRLSSEASRPVMQAFAPFCKNQGRCVFVVSASAPSSEPSPLGPSSFALLHRLYPASFRRPLTFLPFPSDSLLSAPPKGPTKEQNPRTP